MYFAGEMLSVPGMAHQVSVVAANHNIKANSIDNVLVGRVSAEEFSEAWKEGRQLKRLMEEDLRKSYDFTTVLVDPPRAGLDAESCKVLIYLSGGISACHDMMLLVGSNCAILPPCR